MRIRKANGLGWAVPPNKGKTYPPEVLTRAMVVSPSPDRTRMASTVSRTVAGTDESKTSARRSATSSRTTA